MSIVNEKGDCKVKQLKKQPESTVTVKEEDVENYSRTIHDLSVKARSTIRDLDPTDDLTFLRIRSEKNEIMIAPDNENFLIVWQSLAEKQE